MGYVNRLDALHMKHEELADLMLEKQAIAAAAITVAIQFGGYSAESEIEKRIARYKAQVDNTR